MGGVPYDTVITGDCLLVETTVDSNLAVVFSDGLTEVTVTDVLEPFENRKSFINIWRHFKMLVI